MGISLSSYSILASCTTKCKWSNNTRLCITIKRISHHETAFEVEHVGVTENSAHEHDAVLVFVDPTTTYSFFFFLWWFRIFERKYPVVSMKKIIYPNFISSHFIYLCKLRHQSDICMYVNVEWNIIFITKMLEAELFYWLIEKKILGWQMIMIGRLNIR